MSFDSSSDLETGFIGKIGPWTLAMEMPLSKKCDERSIFA
jgi:hypothetical protein